MPAFNQDPISRSRGVRSSARAHLARLREDRLQKRMAALPAAATAPSHAAVQAPAPSPDASALPSAATMPPDGMSRAPDLSAVASAPDDIPGEIPGDVEDMALTIESPGASHVADGSSDAVSGAAAVLPDADPVAALPAAPLPPAPESAAQAAGPDTAPEAPASADAPQPAAEPSTDRAEPSEDTVSFPQDASSDLVDLPGAGPGLVWLLQECGVTSMAELALADATDLSQKLGIVGQLLDLEHWITHARANS